MVLPVPLAAPLMRGVRPLLADRIAEVYKFDYCDKVTARFKMEVVFNEFRS